MLNRYRRNLKRWRKRITGRSMLRTGQRFGTNFLSGGPVQAVSSEAKRFFSTIVSTTQLGAPHTQSLTIIPRNIDSVATATDNRDSRKISVSGLSVKLAISADTSFLTGFGAYRIIVARFQTGTEDISAIGFWTPVGATRNIRILYDKHFAISGQTMYGDKSNYVHDFYLKNNSIVEYSGNQVDGTDNDRGTLKMYIFADVGTDVLNINGGITTHFREMV